MRCIRPVDRGLMLPGILCYKMDFLIKDGVVHDMVMDRVLCNPLNDDSGRDTVSKKDTGLILVSTNCSSLWNVRDQM